MNVLLVDDDIELVSMLQEYLRNEGVATQVCLTGLEGIKQAETGQFDVMLLDIMLPDMSGIEVLNYVHSHCNLPVIMLTAKGDNIDRVLGLEMGADDYVPKPCYPREVLARLRAVLRRSAERIPRQDERVLTLRSLSLNLLQHTCHWQSSPIELTVTEFNLLAVLLKYQTRVVTKDELSELAMGRARELYDRSIDVHISNIRQKLSQITNNNVAIETVRSVGYWIK